MPIAGPHRLGLVALGLVGAFSTPLLAQQIIRPRFGAGRPVALSGRVQGRAYVDYVITGQAGRMLQVQLRSRSNSLSFNVLPPASDDAAMFIAGVSNDTASLRLPDDGTYRVRVYLVRAAARRGERAQYELLLSLRGTALQALSRNVDATVAGSRFHASAQISCTYAGASTSTCEAFAVRRRPNGTATIVVHWAGRVGRRLLFEGGTVVASDAPQPLRVERRGDVTVVTMSNDERYVIPDALVRGG